MESRTSRRPGDWVDTAAGWLRSGKWLGELIAGIVLALLATSFQLNSQQGPNPGKPIVSPEAGSVPDAQMARPEQQDEKQSFETANIERKRQFTDDSAKLLKLANDLKAEVDKTSKDTLSLGVIRKADEIEHLAHNVREKMKLKMSASN